jgi:hypothetical protein
MKSHPPVLRLCLLVLLSTPLLAGCGSSVAVVPVTGKVTVDGQPLTAGQVSLVPLEAKPGAVASAGAIDANGDYVIYTGGKTGAPPGKYKVTVTPAMLPSGDNKKPVIPFNQKFGDATKTTLSIDVVSSPAPGAYDLKLTK